MFGLAREQLDITLGQVAKGAMGVLSTENRKIWSSLRSSMSSDKNNASCLHIVDNALFIVCLDDATPANLADMCSTFLCGTYVMDNGVQVGTCTNRWYDKVCAHILRCTTLMDLFGFQLQIIVCADGSAGINFEHTGVDGHTVLR